MTLNDLADQQTADLASLTRVNGIRPNTAALSAAELLHNLAVQTDANPLPPETRQIDLAARRAELFDAHAAALHQLHYLEGALNEIDYLLELTNPQPAETAEGALT